jgi:hypothetical protein
MLKIIAAVIAVLASVAPLHAGVTINYEGAASSKEAIAKILATATAIAKKNQWKIADASAEHVTLERVVNEKPVRYEGRLTGVVIYPSEKCEPVQLQFGDDLFMQDFTKTQFAGAEIHVKVIELFLAIRPFFKKLTIDDEGEYWETRDRRLLEQHLGETNSAIEAIKSKR